MPCLERLLRPAGDVDTMILDKTGTITFGNRLAAEFYPVKGASREELIQFSVMSSLLDPTPEGKSTVELGRKQGCILGAEVPAGMTFVNLRPKVK